MPLILTPTLRNRLYVVESDHEGDDSTIYSLRAIPMGNGLVKSAAS